MKIFGLITADLMFHSRASGAAQNAGVTLLVARALEKLFERLQSIENAKTEDVAWLLIDLSTPNLDVGALVNEARVSLPSTRLLAYGPHVHVDALAAARAAGVDSVLTRGQFDHQLNEIFAS